MASLFQRFHFFWLSPHYHLFMVLLGSHQLLSLARSQLSYKSQGLKLLGQLVHLVPST